MRQWPKVEDVFALGAPDYLVVGPGFTCMEEWSVKTVYDDGTEHGGLYVKCSGPGGRHYLDAQIIHGRLEGFYRVEDV